jgi:hypothetical protein
LLRGGGEVGVVGPQHLLIYRERALVEWLSLAVAALCLVEHGEVVEVRGEVGVVGLQRILVDGKRALVEWLGLGVAALLAVKVGQLGDEWGSEPAMSE